MIKQRKLAEYYRFNIVVSQKISIYDNTPYWYFEITDKDGKELPSYRQKFTPSQWIRAKQYLTRRLVPFAGYTYELKPEYNKVATYKII